MLFPTFCNDEDGGDEVDAADNDADNRFTGESGMVITEDDFNPLLVLRTTGTNSAKIKKIKKIKNGRITSSDRRERGEKKKSNTSQNKDSQRLETNARGIVDDCEERGSLKRKGS